MVTASWLATLLDQSMLEQEDLLNKRGPIAHRLTPDSELPERPGQEVADELGGRFLLRYMLPHQVDQVHGGSNHLTYTTPTAYRSEDVVEYLRLPRPQAQRPFVSLLNPALISKISGPRWIAGGIGIEYLLPQGYPQEALVPPSYPMQIG
jgi:hypothetical protein